MSSSNSPYLQPEEDTIATTYEHVLQPLTSTISSSTLVSFDGSTLFGPALHLTGLSLTTYDVDFNPNFYSTDNICIPENTPLSTFQPNVSYYTPVSEASDFSEIITPVSLQPPIDFRSSPAPRAGARHLSPIPQHGDASTPSRPRSRANIFRPSVQCPRTPEPTRISRDGLGIVTTIQSTPASSPAQINHTPSLSSISDRIPPPPRRYYTPIAPNPVGLRQIQANKRSLSSDDEDFYSKKQKISESSPMTNVEISDEDSFLLKLKDEDRLSWKDIASRFQSDLSKTVQIPALQMRLKRLRERIKVWTDVDVQALRMAHDYYASNKFEIIAAKMADYGAADKFSSKQCTRKWQEISTPNQDPTISQFARTPTWSTTYTASPIDANDGFFPFVSAS